MPERRMALVAVAFAVGILAGDFVSLLGLAMIAASVVAIALLLAPANLRAPIVLVAAIVLSGAWRYAADRSVSPNDISHFARGVSAFEGSVASDVTGAPDSLRLTFRVNRAQMGGKWRPADGDVMVSFYTNENAEHSRPFVANTTASAEQSRECSSHDSNGNATMPRLEYGDRARILVPPYIPSEPTNPGQFSWKGYLARRGIYACASVREPEQVEVLRRSRSHSLIGAALAAKRYLVSSICRIHPAKEASVMCGVVLGTYSYLDDDTLRAFTRTGTLHVLAASGYNCMILVVILSPLLRLSRVFPKYRGIAVVLSIVIYLMMVGPVPSLVRAAVMSSLLLLAGPFQRIADYRNLFYVALFIVLLFSPSNLFDIGFQLSFLAVWGLIAVAPVIDSLMSHTNLSELKDGRSWRRRRRWLPRAVAWCRMWFVGLVASTAVGTIAVSLVTAPIVAYYFHNISLTSLPANLAVALVVPAVFADSFLSAITGLAPHWCAGWIGGIGTLSTRSMVSVVDYLGSLSHSAVAVQSPGILGILGYYVVLYAVAGYVRSRYGAR